jgi:pimeloyl-ACP methyl ester carboxylesterase
MLLAALPHTAVARPTTRALLNDLGGTPCPNSAFTCLALQVPLDHFNLQDPRTVNVMFAVLPATGTRKGMFVTATGGPGTAGIALADEYLSYLDPRIPQQFDIVFFDQRGIGLSGGLDCLEPATRWYQANWRADTPLHEQQLETSVQNFALVCDSENGKPAMLPYLGTTQAVLDLEMFRAAMQDDKFWLYGESYGTQYAQTYAHAHPEHLAGMILDGTVDLTLDGITYYSRVAGAFNDTLVAALRRLRFTDLEFVGIGEMYGEYGRMLLVRALTAHARSGDLVPLTRLLYPNVGVDENTLRPVADPTW